MGDKSPKNKEKMKKKSAEKNASAPVSSSIKTQGNFKEVK